MAEGGGDQVDQQVQLPHEEPQGDEEQEQRRQDAAALEEARVQIEAAAIQNNEVNLRDQLDEAEQQQAIPLAAAAQPIDPVAAEPFDQEPEDQQPPPILAPIALPAMVHVPLVPLPGGGGGLGGIPLLQPLLLRRASISSLDESSQKCDESKAGFFPLLQSSHGGRPSYRNPSHPARALDVLQQMRKSKELTDVTLAAGDVEVAAHKNVLAACSPYFFAMFTGFMEEKTKDRIALKDVDPEALVTLVDYAYTAKVEVNEDNVQPLLQAANLLQLVDVTDACCQFLHSQLHPSNCLGIRAFADLHGCAELKEQAEKYAETHFAEVLDCDEFLALQVDQVRELICSDTITVPSEEKVYESVLMWVRHDADGRRCHLPRKEKLRFRSKNVLMKPNFILNLA
jgi:hypothetical protein